MPTVRVNTSTHISASLEDVFNYVSDLSKHPEWSADDDLKIEAVSEGPPAVGGEYKSSVTFMGNELNAQTKVTALDSPTKFSFTVTEPDSTHDHEFTFEGEAGGTRLERRVAHNLPLIKSIMFRLIGAPFVAKPAHKKAYAKLKEKLES